MSNTSLKEVEIDGHVYEIEDGEKEEVIDDELEDEDVFNYYELEDDLEEENLFYKNTDSFKCLAQILISRSSLLRHVLYHFPELKDPGIDAAFNYIEPEITYDDVGVEKYKNLCKELKIVPLTRVINSLSTDELDLKYYGLTDTQIKAICSTLMLNNRVKKLIFRDNWMKSDATFWLGEMLRENNSIEILDLRECRIGVDGALNICEGLSLNVCLKELDLSFNNLGDEGLEPLMKGLKENQQLKVLNLSHNNLANGAGKSLALFLPDNFSVEVLDLSWNDLYTKDGLKQLCNGLSLNSMLKQLNLAWNGIGSKETLGPIIKYLKSTTVLEHMDLSHNRIKAEGIKMVRSGIFKNESLISINLGFNVITPEEALFLINVFTMKRDEPLKLKYLDLENAFIDKKAVPIWKKVLKMDKNVRIEGIVNNFTIMGPDINRLLFERAKYLAEKPKSKKQKKDFGHFIYELPEGVLDKSDFQKLVKKNKLKLIDKDLSAAIADKFKLKNGKVDLNTLKKVYLEMYPETQPPPPKPKKGKKGKKFKKEKDPVALEAETETQEKGIGTEPVLQNDMDITKIKSDNKILQENISKSKFSSYPVINEEDNKDD